MVIDEQILTKINWLKKSLSWNCVFCKYKFSREYVGKVILTLPICSLCLDRYEMIRNKDITLRQKQFLNNWFAGECYLCERVVGKDNLKKLDQGFYLCQTACYQRFRMIASWQEKNNKATNASQPIKTSIPFNNSFVSYASASQALHNARRTGSHFVHKELQELERRNKK